jgi:hypothetical protein
MRRPRRKDQKEPMNNTAQQQPETFPDSFKVTLEAIQRDQDAAEAELAECNRKTLAIRKRVDELRRAKAALLVLLGEPPDSPQDGAQGIPFVEIVGTLFRRVARPMRIREVVDHLRTAGQELPDPPKDYKKVNMVMYNYPDRFVRTERGLWTLKDQ